MEKDQKTNHYYSAEQDSKFKLRTVNANFFGKSINLNTASGVFSFKQVDLGTKIMLENCIIKDDWHVLDLGCGNGIVGIAIALGFPNTKVIMTDVNKRAIKTTRINIKANRIMNAQAIEGDLYDPIKNELFDTILLNPPQSAGKEICFAMMQKSKDHLKENGLLQVVARHNKGGNSLSAEMKRIFGNLDILAKESGYWIYASKKEG